METMLQNTLTVTTMNDFVNEHSPIKFAEFVLDKTNANEFFNINFELETSNKRTNFFYFRIVFRVWSKWIFYRGNTLKWGYLC
jgi:hypothetical protein